ncbi:MAG: cyclic nucleotide-binding domain-containing protein [Spirochaetales bacterium]
MVHDALSSLKALLPLTDAEQAAWPAVARVQSVPAKAPLGRLGEPCTRLTFVNSGLLRVSFLTEGSWYTDFESFSTGGPSREHLQALEDSEVVQVEKADLERLYQHHPNLERVGRLLTETARPRPY